MAGNGGGERSATGPLFVIYCSLSPPLHPDTHTIYEDNRRARCAPLEHSPDGCTRSREKGSGRGRDDPGRRALPGAVSPLCVWSKRCASCVATERFEEKLRGPSVRAGGTRARAPPARMFREMPPRHQMSVECQRLRCLWCSPFIFRVVSPPPH